MKRKAQKETYDDDPIIQAALEKQKRTKLVKVLIIVLSYFILFIGVALIIIGAIFSITPCIIAGVVVCSVGVLPLIIVGLIYYDIAL